MFYIYFFLPLQLNASGDCFFKNHFIYYCDHTWRPRVSAKIEKIEARSWAFWWRMSLVRSGLAPVPWISGTLPGTQAHAALPVTCPP